MFVCSAWLIKALFKTEFSSVFALLSVYMYGNQDLVNPKMIFFGETPRYYHNLYLSHANLGKKGTR
jgi:hypothetical protein